MKIILASFFIFAFCLIGFGQDSPTIKTSKNQVVSVSNALGKVEDMVCKFPRIYSGTVMKRDFADDELTVTSFVLSDAKDERRAINLNNEQLALLGRNSVSIISSLLAKGNKVRVSTYECNGGGSGIFIYAESITLIK